MPWDFHRKLTAELSLGTFITIVFMRLLQARHIGRPKGMRKMRVNFTEENYNVENRPSVERLHISGVWICQNKIPGSVTARSERGWPSEQRLEEGAAFSVSAC